MYEMAILADDLSGAADCGIACVEAGLRTNVILAPQAHDATTDVVAIDLDTRRMQPAPAASATRHAVRMYADKARRLFKKIDSLLRGNIGVELAAALEELGNHAQAAGQYRPIAVVAPAFPKTGRTTRNGRQFLQGVPLEQSGIWSEQDSNLSSYIPELLYQAGLRSEVIPLPLIRSIPAELHQQVSKLAAKSDILICDAETDEELRVVATAFASIERSVLWTGSAGLARQVAQQARLSTCFHHTTGDVSFQAGPMVFVVGSRSQVSRSQVELLTRAKELRRMAISIECLHAGPASSTWQIIESEFADAIANGADVVLLPEPDGNASPGQAATLCPALGQLVSSCAHKIGALVATGGETAREILDVLGIHRLRLVGELEPGVAFSITEGWRRQLPVITKAGSFGDVHTLLHCRNFLRQFPREEGMKVV